MLEQVHTWGDLIKQDKKINFKMSYEFSSESVLLDYAWTRQSS